VAAGSVWRGGGWADPLWPGPDGRIVDQRTLRSSQRQTDGGPCMGIYARFPHADLGGVWIELQLLSALDLCEVTVKRTEWQMSGLPGKLQHQAIGKTQGRTRAEEIERRRHDVRIL